MVAVSGLVLDYDTELPISGATVYIFVPTSGTLYTAILSQANGFFSVEKPVVNSGTDLVYTAYKSGYKGFSLNYDQAVSQLALYLKQYSTVPNASGGSYINLTNNPLTTGQKIVDMSSSPCHYFFITEGGLDIVDRNTFLNVGYYKNTNLSCISVMPTACTRSGVLLGTTNSGVFEFALPSPSGYPLNRNISSIINSRYSVAGGKLTSNNVQCIKRNSSGNVAIGTLSGIDYQILDGNVRYFMSYSGVVSGTTAITISENNDIYYSPTNSGVHVKYSPVADWNVNSYDYRVVLSGTGEYPFPLKNNYINIIDLTSVSGENSVYIGCISGAVAYTENRGDLNISASGARLYTVFS